MKQFDDIFRDKVRDAFGSYNVDHSADEGWNSFVRKQKAGKRFAIIIPIWAKAASVALLISLGGLYIYKSSIHTPVSVAVTEDFVIPEAPLIKNEAGFISNVVSPESHAGTDVGIRPSETSTVVSMLHDVNHEKEKTAQRIAQNAEVQHEDKVNKKTFTAVKESMEDTAILNKVKTEVSTEEFAEDEKYERKTSLMAGLAGMMSGVKDVSAGAPGLSVGFYIDQKLSRRLSFRPGIALARYAYSSVSVSYDKVQGSASASFNSSSGYIDSYDNKLDLITMEIPLNFAYTIFERRKSSFFISAGASTVIYLNQQFSGDYVGTFTNQSYDVASGTLNEYKSTQAFDVEQEEKAFSHVDYFGLANLSAGYSFPLGKSSMLIEPFVQLPTSVLTSLDLKIRYGGLSLKFRFGHQ